MNAPRGPEVRPPDPIDATQGIARDPPQSNNITATPTPMPGTIEYFSQDSSHFAMLLGRNAEPRPGYECLFQETTAVVLEKMRNKDPSWENAGKAQGAYKSNQ